MCLCNFWLLSLYELATEQVPDGIYWAWSSRKEREIHYSLYINIDINLSLRIQLKGREKQIY